MMKNTLCLLVFIFVFNLIAQKVIYPIYTNDTGKIVTEIEATYYTIIQDIEDDVYPFLEYTYPYNQLVAMGSFKSLNPNIKYGKFTYYNENTGKVKSTYHYINDTLNGEKTMYDYLGNIKYIEQYKSNKLNGDCKYFYANGNIRRIENYKDGNLTFGKCYKLNGEDTLYFPRITKPKFRNYRYINFQDYVYDHSDYSKNIKYETGTVEISFIVLIDGSIDRNSIKLIKGQEFPILSK